MIQNLHISNYKSINQLDLFDCKRINVFIGEPNSGKSNILEALDLSYLSWMMAMNDGNSKAGKDLIDLKRFFRIDKVEDMFHNGNLSTPIIISRAGQSYDMQLESRHDKKDDTRFFECATTTGSFTRFDNDLNPVEPVQFFASPIKPYRYKSNIQFHDTGNYFDRLMAPFGNNLGKVIRGNMDMRDLVKELAEKNNFELNIDKVTEAISIQVRINEGLVQTLNYEALADTFKRIIFFAAAVRHNNASVITFDEPDTHAFPPFVSYLADEIIEQKKTQFFIATHNPYLLNSLIENSPAGDLSVFVCGFEKLKMTSIAKRLSENDLSELLDFGVDIFFNLNRYLNDSIEYSS